MTRKIFLTDTPFPTSAEVIAEANAFGAGEIVHCAADGSFPKAIRELGINSLGFHEIVTDEDSLSSVPSKISAAQALTVLDSIGLLDEAQAMIDAPSTPTAIKIFWNREHEFNRDSPALNAMAAQLGLSQEQVDDLFRAAAQIAV